MIELRQNIPGFYKGLIYCVEALKEADEIIDYLLSCNDELNIKVKRGCSEFDLAYPSFAKVKPSFSESINYLAEWKSLEKSFDKTCTEENHPTHFPLLRYSV